MRAHFPQGRHLFTALPWHTSFRQLRRDASSGAKGNPELQNVRLRAGNNRPLPLPPTLQPVSTPLRPNWKEHKPDPDLSNLTPFQQKLYQNPYAHTLATPVRQCVVSGLRLPSDFLAALHIKLHPTTSAPWLVPATLASKSNDHGVPARYLAREAMFSHLSRVGKHWKLTLPLRLAENLRSRIDQVVWREDMAALLLSILRKELVTKLRWFFGKKSIALVPCESTTPTDLNRIDHVSCVLLLHTLKTDVDHLQRELVEIMRSIERTAASLTKMHRAKYDTRKKSSNPPPHVPRLQPSLRFSPLDFPTILWQGRQVPVYSLYDLLGEENLAELVKDSRFQNEEILIMKESRITVIAQTKLMQLQAYLAKSKP